MSLRPILKWPDERLTRACQPVAEINDGDGLTVISGLTVGLAAEDIVLDSVSITAGQTVTITSATITHAT